MLGNLPKLTLADDHATQGSPRNPRQDVDSLLHLIPLDQCRQFPPTRQNLVRLMLARDVRLGLIMKQVIVEDDLEAIHQAVRDRPVAVLLLEKTDAQRVWTTQTREGHALLGVTEERDHAAAHAVRHLAHPKSRMHIANEA
jgi:hypothetical protein